MDFLLMVDILPFFLWLMLLQWRIVVQIWSESWVRTFRELNKPRFLRFLDPLSLGHGESTTAPRVPKSLRLLIKVDLRFFVQKYFSISLVQMWRFRQPLSWYLRLQLLCIIKGALDRGEISQISLWRDIVLESWIEPRLHVRPVGRPTERWFYRLLCVMELGWLWVMSSLIIMRVYFRSRHRL